MTRRRQARIDGDIQDIIDEKALKRWGPSQIYKHLELLEAQGKIPLGPKGESRIPESVRTVQRRVKDLTPRDPTGPWRWWEADPDDGRLALDVLAEAIVRTEGRITQLTQREADWISRLRRMLPDVPLWVIYLLARGYMLQEDEGPQYIAPEDILLFTPGRSPEHEQRWLRVLELREEGKAPPERPWAIRLPVDPAQKEDDNGKPTRKQ